MKKFLTLGIFLSVMLFTSQTGECRMPDNNRPAPHYSGQMHQMQKYHQPGAVKRRAPVYNYAPAKRPHRIGEYTVHYRGARPYRIGSSRIIYAPDGRIQFIGSYPVVYRGSRIFSIGGSPVIYGIGNEILRIGNFAVYYD